MRRLKRKGKPGSMNDEVTEVGSEILPPQPTAVTEACQPPSSPPHSESIKWKESGCPQGGMQ